MTRHRQIKKSRIWKVLHLSLNNERNEIVFDFFRNNVVYIRTTKTRKPDRLSHYYFGDPTLMKRTKSFIVLNHDFWFRKLNY